MTDAQNPDAAAAPADTAGAEDADARGRMRAGLISSALSLIENEGIAAFTLRGVCAKAGAPERPSPGPRPRI